ncbi:MAG: hypothetical protein ACPGDB_05230, partial [Fusobacterium sp.]
MKISQLKTIVKEAVKEAIQEEMKDILLEAVRSPKQVVSEYKPTNSSVDAPSPTNPVAIKSREEIRENYMKVLGDMRPGQDTLSFNSTDARNMGGNLQVTPGMNTSGEGSQ